MALICAGAMLFAAVEVAAESTSPIALVGAGSTFAAPLSYKWLGLYRMEHPDLAITYDAVGSSDGIARSVAGSVDVVGSDAAISETDAPRVTRGVRVVPANAGLVVLNYNLPSLGGRSLGNLLGFIALPANVAAQSQTAVRSIQ